MFKRKELWTIGPSRHLWSLNFTTENASQIIGSHDGSEGSLIIRQGLSFQRLIEDLSTPFSILAFAINSANTLKPYSVSRVIINSLAVCESTSCPICFSSTNFRDKTYQNYLYQKGYDKIMLFFTTPPISQEEFTQLLGIQAPWAVPDGLCLP